MDLRQLQLQNILTEHLQNMHGSLCSIKFTCQQNNSRQGLREITKSQIFIIFAHVHSIVNSCIQLRFARVICQIVCLVMLYILFNCTMFIRGLLDALVQECQLLLSAGSPCLLLFCRHVNLMLQRDPCIFWRCSVRMFCSYSRN